MKENIIITGPYRSGTTWLGSVIGKAKCTRHIYEPFGPDNIDWFRDADIYINNIFPEKSDQNYNLIMNDIKNIFNNKINLTKLIGKLKYLNKRKWFITLYNLILSNIHNKKVVIKDPNLIFLIEDIYKEFSPKIIITLRHPCAFVSSYKRVQWTGYVDKFKRQKRLMRKIKSLDIDLYNKLLKKKNYCLVEEASICWLVYHTFVKLYKKKYANWLFVKHEQCSKEPQKYFKIIFDYINLDLSDKIKDYIQKTTKSTVSSKDILNSNQLHILNRDSKKSLSLWKENLDDKEISIIKKQTFKLYKELYEAESF